MIHLSPWVVTNDVLYYWCHCRCFLHTDWFYTVIVLSGTCMMVTIYVRVIHGTPEMKGCVTNFYLVETCHMVLVYSSNIDALLHVYLKQEVISTFVWCVSRYKTWVCCCTFNFYSMYITTLRNTKYWKTCGSTDSQIKLLF
jgi:hypothetical protein